MNMEVRVVIMDSKLELFLSKELEPLLDENFQVEIEGYGVFSFQHKDWRTNELKRIWRIEDMKQL